MRAAFARAVGRMSRTKREARSRGASASAAAASGAGRRRAEMTLMNLAESITTDLVNRVPDWSRMRGDGGGSVFKSVSAVIVFEGKRRRVPLPVDLFTASRDMQVGYIYGFLTRMTRSIMSKCMECGKVGQDMFTFDGMTVVKMPRRKDAHCR